MAKVYGRSKIHPQLVGRGWAALILVEANLQSKVADTIKGDARYSQGGSEKLSQAALWDWVPYLATSEKAAYELKYRLEGRWNFWTKLYTQFSRGKR